MDILLDEFYRSDLHVGHYVERKLQLDDASSYQIVGIAGSGKTALIKHYLLSRRKSSYLYIDCRDLRIDPGALGPLLGPFCAEHGIDCLALDNYDGSFALPPDLRLILAAERPADFAGCETHLIRPLDYEEFLAYEHKFDSTALNHYLQLGGFPGMHRVSSEERVRYLQQILQRALTPMGMDIMIQSSRMVTRKVSAFMLYERLKGERKISKDMLYQTLQDLCDRGYLHLIPKFGHERAVKKLYLCDIALKNALSIQKHFGRLFENLVCLEMLKRGYLLTYEEGIDFYLPPQQRIVLCMPFGNQEMLFKKIESIEAFIVTQGITRVEVITMSTESSLRHPFVTVEMIPFGIWALVEGE